MTDKFHIFPYSNGKRAVLKKNKDTKLDSNTREIMDYIHADTEFIGGTVVIHGNMEL